MEEIKQQIQHILEQYTTQGHIHRESSDSLNTCIEYIITLSEEYLIEELINALKDNIPFITPAYINLSEEQIKLYIYI